MKAIVMRAFLELKNGAFVSTVDMLEQPDSWRDLTPQSQRLIKRYAALLMNAALK